MAIKLDKCQRWNPVKLYLKEHFGIVVNFCNRSSDYYTAWQYVTKEDQVFIECDRHPDLSSETRHSPAQWLQAKHRETIRLNLTLMISFSMVHR